MEFAKKEDRRLIEDLVNKYYKEHPEEEVKARQNTLLEFAIPAGLVGAATYGATRGKLGGQEFIATGIPSGLFVNYLGNRGRQQKILKEQGVETSVAYPGVQSAPKELREKYASAPPTAGKETLRILRQVGKKKTNNPTYRTKETGEKLTGAPQNVVDNFNKRYDKIYKARASENLKGKSLWGMTGVAGVTGRNKVKTAQIEKVTPMRSALSLAIPSIGGAGLGGAATALHPDIEKTKKNYRDSMLLGFLGGAGFGGLAIATHKIPQLARVAQEGGEELAGAFRKKV